MQRVIMFLLGAVAIFVLAVTTADAAKPGGSVALGVAGVPDYEGSNDFEALPVLISRYTWASGQYLHIGGTADAGRAAQIKANLMPESRSPTWQMGPVLQYRLGRDSVKDNQADNMKDIDDAVELGFFVGEERGPMYVGFNFVTDVSDKHEGFVAELAGTYTNKVSDRLQVMLGAGLAFANSDYMETYFGITPADSVKSGLPVYTPDDAVKDIGFSISTRYTPGANWGIMGFIKYNALLGDAKDSPLVDDEGSYNQPIAGAAITYTY